LVVLIGNPNLEVNMGDIIPSGYVDRFAAELQALGLPTLTLTSDPTLRTKLGNKRDEYSIRLSDCGFDTLNTACKLAIIESLLEGPSVTPLLVIQRIAQPRLAAYVYREMERLEAEEGLSQEQCMEKLLETLRECWDVVEDYNETGGQYLKGGTGLRLGFLPPTEHHPAVRP
jgi:hypothetical protein